MNGQYIIPGSEAIGEHQVRSIEGAQKPSTPENAVAHHARYKSIENSIKNMRDNATEEMLPRSARTKVLELFTATPRPLVDRLIEEESAIGGRIFERDSSVLWQRFWCHEDDWFFEQSYTTPSGESQVVLHYRIRDDGIDKFYGGSKYKPSEAETARLLYAIEEYYQNIQQQLYGK